MSTTEQSYDNQVTILKENGCEKIFVEKVTGTTTTQREELKRALEMTRKGDILLVTKIDRLARSIIDLNKIVNELKEKGVSVRFIKENIEFTADEKENSLQTLLFNILGSFAQFERDLIVERTKEGRERAKKEGKHLGRPGQSEKAVKRALKLYENRSVNGMSINDIVNATGVPKSTIYKKIKERL